MKVIMENINKLLKRKEVVVVGKYDSNPGFAKVHEDIAKKFDVGSDLVVVRTIQGGFGTHEFKIDAFIYDSVKDKEMIEPKKKEKKKIGEVVAAPAVKAGDKK